MVFIMVIFMAVTDLEQTYVQSVIPDYTATGETNVDSTDRNLFVCPSNV
jgi:hypothetical protein